MQDYNFYGLSPVDFQHMVQSLAKTIIAPGLSALGEGPDGGRDMYFRGRMQYPSLTDCWDGYLVIGCKFKSKPSTSAADGSWAVQQLKADLEKFKNPPKGLTRPEYFIFATNVFLTAAPGAGTRAQVEDMLACARSQLGLKGTDVWDGNDLRAFLNRDESVRTSYGSLVTVGDILSQIYQSIVTPLGSVEVMHSFLQKELLADAFAKLQSAGEDPDVQVFLSNVFVDLPAVQSHNRAVQSGGSGEFMIVQSLFTAAGNMCRAPEESSQHGENSSFAPNSRFVLVGGPGQGKSTIGQYICQCYRAAILKDRLYHVDIKVRNAVKLLEAARSAEGGLPIVRRFPVRIELHRFAAALAQDQALTLLGYIRSNIARLGSGAITLEGVRAWLQKYPWFVVFDGLDEVPPSSNRPEILRQIDGFMVDAASSNADIVVLITTRPQSYTNEFSATHWRHYYLTPLSDEHALLYGKRLAEARCGDDQGRRDDLMLALNAACQNEITARLMQSPLQVTIMATLLENLGEPPQQRYTLFREYYETTYKRETKRQLLGGILTKRKLDIDNIHQTVGLLLHAAGEGSARNPKKNAHRPMDPSLTDAQFAEIVRDRLESIGVDSTTIDDLISQICAGSILRLVFLVRPTDGIIRFDIASLQEFMAAESLVDGRDDLVLNRMRGIASASYWRNVFLFAIGKCLVQRPYLVDSVVSICYDLNFRHLSMPVVKDEIVSQAASAVGWGALLALDILREGTARTNPNIERRLLQIVLERLHIVALHNSTEMASVYRNEYEFEFRESIVKNINSNRVDHRIGALKMLISLTDLDVTWARNILEQHWPNNQEEQDGILLLEDPFIEDLGRWAYARIFERASSLNGNRLADFMFSVDLANDMQPNNIPSEWVPMLDVVSARESSLNVRFLLATVHGFEWESRIQPISAASGLLKLMQEISPTWSSGWAPVIAAGKLASEPTKECLSEQLISLADQWSEFDLRGFHLPWPLASVLNASNSASDLRRFAQLTLDGRLGDTQDWSAAESRWTGQGVNLQDLEMSTDDRWPFGDNIGEVGFPFGIVQPRLTGSVSKVSLAVSVELAMSLPGEKARDWAARAILQTAWRRAEKELSGNDFARYVWRLLPLIDRRKSTRVHLSPGQLLEVLDRFPDSSDLINLLNEESSLFSFSTTRTPVDCEPLVRHLSVSPRTRVGLLSVLVALVHARCQCNVPRSVLQQVAQVSPQCQSHVNLLTIARNDTDEVEMRGALAEIARDPSNNYRSLIRAMRITSLKDNDNAYVGALTALEALQDPLARSDTKAMGAFADALNTLRMRLQRRPSALADPTVWGELQLPRRPRLS